MENISAKKIKELIDKANETKRPHVGDWSMNMAYYMGEQNTKYSVAQNQLIHIGNTKGEQYVMNVIHPTVQTVSAKVTAPNPVIKVIPSTGNSSDIYAAKIGEMVAQAELWDNFNMQVELQKFIPTMATCGSIAMHFYFNPKAGRYYTAEELNKMAQDAGDTKSVFEEGAHEGRVEFDLVTPFELNASQFALSDIDAEWMSISKLRSLDWVYEMYQKKVKPSKNIKISEVYSSFNASVNGRSYQENDGEQVLVHLFYLRKCEKYPLGGVWVCTDEGEMLYNNEEYKLPYGLEKTDTIPIVKIDYENLQNRFWGIAPVSYVRPMQRTVNMIWSMYMAHCKTYAYSTVLNPLGNGLTKEKYDPSRPRNWMDYVTNAGDSNGGSPHFMSPPPFNPQILDAMSVARRHIEDIFGVHEISRASAPAGVKTGRALSILDAADDTKIHPVVIQIENGISRGCQIGLQIIENTYTIPRIVKMVGKPNARMVRSFKGDKLGGNTDVKVKLRTPLPMNKMAAMDTAITLWREGIVPKTEEGLKTVQTMIDMEYFNVGLESTKSEEQADYENSVLDTGAKGQEQDVPIVNPETGEPEMNEDGTPMTERKFVGMPRNDWDNDMLHLKQHESRQMEIDYFEIIQEKPEVHEAYTLHKQQHREALLRKEELAMQDQKQNENEMMMKQAEMKKAITEIETKYKIMFEEAKAQFREETEIAIEEAKAIYSSGKNNEKGRGETQ